MIAGAVFGAGPGTAVITSILAGRTSLEPRALTIIAGLLYVAAGACWFSLLGAEVDSLSAYFLGLIMTGAGAGMGQTGFLAGGAASLPPDQYAAGTGIINTARQIGAAIGVAVFISVSDSAMHAHQFKTAWLLMGAFGLLATCSALLLRPRTEK